MAIDQNALLAAIDAARSNSYGSDEQSELGARRAAAIDYYLGHNTIPAPEGRSQVVDRSVFETISVILPSLVRIFASSAEEVCKAIPVGPDDEGGAEQTTAVLNHIVTQQNQWEQICSDWIHDACLLSNGYAMAYWDDSKNIVREQYEGQSDDQIASLLSDGNVQVIEHSQKPDEEANKAAAEAFQQAQQQFQQAAQQWQQAAMQAQQQGQQPPPQPQPPQPPQPAFLHDVVIERQEHDGKVCIKVLPPEHCKVSADTPDWTLKECPFFEYREYKTLSDLRAMGLDVSDDISDDEDEDREEDDARDRFGEDDLESDGKGSMRRVWARMIWVKAEAEGDGQSRLYYVIAVGKTILYSEPVGRIPVASMTPQPLPHRHIGMSIAETVMDIQDIKTAVTRGGLDNLYLANNGRHAVSSKVNLEDFLSSAPGGLVRMLDDSLPSEGHIMPLTHPFAFDSIIGSLEYFDQSRQNRSGASRYFSGTDANAINKTASGTMALQNMASMRVEHIARMMSPAVEALFSAVHELISKHQNKELAIKLKGKWTLVDPQAWRTKRDIRISVGVGAGNRETMMQQLQGVLAAQMQVGLPLGLVQRENIHATNLEILKLSGFANPAKFWPDPQSLPPQQPQPNPDQMKAQAEMQKEQFRAQNDQQKFAAETQLERERMQMQAQVDQQREEMQARQKQLQMQQEAELEQYRAQLAAEQEQRRMEFEKWKAELDASVKLQIASMSAAPASPEADPQIAQIAQAVTQLMEAIDSPTEIVRGPDGRAVGVKRGNRVRSIQRGPDGRAMGVQ